MSSAVLEIGAVRGAYPERLDRRPGLLDRLGAGLIAPVARRLRGRTPPREKLLAAVHAEARTVETLGDRPFRDAVAALRDRLLREGATEALIARAFALVREAAWRTLSQRHYDAQLVGGRVLLGGMVAEMETGEGKTLTATLPACTFALLGVPVHVVTVNDYLAGRDADWMGPIYRMLGLSVGVIVHGLTPEARRRAYACDITYCSNKELVFDYLRDRMTQGTRPTPIHLKLQRLYDLEPKSRRVVPGLYCAIVDEADSVLVDEARTPLIISGPGGAAPQREIYQAALDVAARLALDRDFIIDREERMIRLTDQGRHRLAALAEPLGGVWRGELRREELAVLALSARHLFIKDRHYLVRENRVELIDEFTGRVMADRKLERGLHQMIEVKEDCAVAAQQTVLARLTYQRFFRRYHWLSGMTGTAREIAPELWAVYGLAVVPVRPHRPVRRRAWPDRMYPCGDDRWAAVVERIRAIHCERRPILVGTRSVAASEQVSALLRAAGLPHRILNARQDREEAEIIAHAGEEGQITVATNMAGRGTDIRLGPGVAKLGGLHVIATERHESGRIDRQLFGRCGRQGDPGSYEAIMALDDELVVTYGEGIWRRLASLLARPGRPLPAWLARPLIRKAQRTAERLHSRIRRDLLRADEQMEHALAFSGHAE
ncbi:MAG: preprotein translocase subunit SecA [Nitrospira sp.]|nr:preprotein translocase subunit SecA [Nitrospira sp.]